MLTSMSRILTSLQSIDFSTMKSENSLIIMKLYIVIFVMSSMKPININLKCSG